MAKDITFIETAEEIIYQVIAGLGLIALAVTAILMLISIGVPTGVIALIGGVFLAGGLILKTMRFGQRSGRIADRVTVLEKNLQALHELGAPCTK